jgi:hypothetical protein
MNVSLPQINPSIYKKCVVGCILKSPMRLFAKFCPANSCEGLAWRSPYKDVHLIIHGPANSEFGEDISGIFLGYIPGDMVRLLVASLVPKSEVCPMGLCCMKVNFD